ncbi:MAG: rhodanese-like domain-containing protein [Bdellovibrio sp.]|nr:rhodanese-like domain-containing protein [Bdellovibrio sp.]
MDFNSIGYFQFNNLLQSRIPLLLLVLDNVDVKPWFNSMIKMHLENITIFCDQDRVVVSVENKKVPSNFGIVVLDADGTKTPTIVRQLEQLGFTNAYYVKGGFQGLSAERES